VERTLPALRPSTTFAIEQLAPEVMGKVVLEVGSRIVQDTAQATLRPLAGRYVGTDIGAGEGVDIVCPVEQLADRFGPASFDVVFATEVVEHVRDWRAAFRNMMAVLRLNGLLVITTRSAGYPYHGSPHDYWRYEAEDMRAIFTGWQLEGCEPDPQRPGILVAARKTTEHEPALEPIALYAMATGRRVRDVTTAQVIWHRLRSPRRAAAWLVPPRLKPPLRRLLSRS
jgi:SAM-dependent methyltransferase